MVSTCVYCGETRKKNSDEGRTFHKFPFKDAEYLDRWLKNMGLGSSLVLSKTSLLCSDHFEQKCFQKDTTKACLLPGSIPTVFRQYKSACVFCHAVKGPNKERSFRKFPLDNAELLQKWIAAINVKDFVANKKSLLCSDHFEEDCFRACGRQSSNLSLRENSVPTIFTLPQTKDHMLNTSRTLTSVQSLPVQSDEHNYTSAERIKLEINNGSLQSDSMQTDSTEYMLNTSRTFSSVQSLPVQLEEHDYTSVERIKLEMNNGSPQLDNHVLDISSTFTAVQPLPVQFDEPDYTSVKSIKLEINNDPPQLDSTQIDSTDHINISRTFTAVQSLPVQLGEHDYTLKLEMNNDSPPLPSISEIQQRAAQADSTDHVLNTSKTSTAVQSLPAQLDEHDYTSVESMKLGMNNAPPPLASISEIQQSAGQAYCTDHALNSPSVIPTAQGYLIPLQQFKLIDYHTDINLHNANVRNTLTSIPAPNTSNTVYSPKKESVWEPRYLKQVKLEHISCPRQRQKYWSKAMKEIDVLRKKVRTLQGKNRRLLNRCNKVKFVMMDIGEQRL